MGTWNRRGSTVVLDLSGARPPPLAPELSEVELPGGTPTTRRGARGPLVGTLQALLRGAGFDPGPVDGIFGSATEAAVRAFQAGRGLAVDGVAGPRTWAALGHGGPEPTYARPAPRASDGRGSVRVEVPFHGYRTNDPAGCFRRCTEMAAAVGTTVGGPGARIQVASREDGSGRVVLDAEKMREGIRYLDAELERGRPVCVGVSYEFGNDYNVDHVTDHFVLVTTRGQAAGGGRFYAFHDPATSHASKGSDLNPVNRFSMSEAGTLYRMPAPGAPMSGELYEVSMVRRNA